MERKPLSLCFFVIFIRASTFAYNLDPDLAIIYVPPTDSDEINRANDSFFGYNILLHSRTYNLVDGSTVYDSSVIVGAPKANYTDHPDHGNKIPEEPGVVYRCPLRGSCKSINVKNPDDEVGFIDQVQLNTLIQKGNGWFGAAMSLDHPSGLLTVCAPRTIVRIYHTFAINYQNTMHGVCYTGELSSDILRMEEKNFSTYDFSSTFWYNPLNGFSVHYPTRKVKMPSDSIRPVIGSPKHELYGTVRQMGQRNPTELPISNDLTQFGYALTSGYYFHEDQLMIAGGAPGWQYVGQVAIMDPRSDPLSIILTIDGNGIGEFFGGSLTTGDLNKDGLDDLIVGSPHWKNDNGRVQIFLGSKGGFFEADLILEGAVNDALYGYAMTSGDLDGDGFDDLIIGAPWEDSGVIYVYNGDAKLREVNSIEYSQRIMASAISENLLRFGFSFATPVDMDGNGFSDIAVGAYASGRAVVILSRPVLKTEMTVTTFPTTLSRNSTSFVVQVCLRNYMKNKPSKWAFECEVTVDEDYKRVVYKESHQMLLTWFNPPDGNACDNTTFYLSNSSSNFIDVIDIVATHRILNSSYESQNHRGNCTLCPIEYRGSHSTIVRTSLPFDIGCGMDDICQAFIFAKLFFQGIRNSTWIIGSDDLSLLLSIGNHAEPAYLTTVTFYMPKGITLRSILPSCQEEGDGEELIVTCDVGNPLGTAMEKKVSLDLDMNRMRNGSTHGTKLDFRVDIKTRSVNRGVMSVAIPLYLRANVSVALSGKAYDKDYYFNSKNEKPSNVTFQHTYQISRFGATPINEARLTIKVPYKYKNLEYLKITNKPRISVLGRFYECSISNVTVSLPLRTNGEKTTSENKFEKIIHLETFANHTRNRRAISENSNKNLFIPTTDTISHVRLVNSKGSEDDDVQSEFYTMPESSNIDVIDLNCSTPNVECGHIACTLAHLKSSQDVGKLHLQFVFDTAKLIGEDNEKGKVINFVTEARLEVADPTMQFVISGTGQAVSVITKFHRAASPKNVSIWIILVSVLLGLLALFVLAIILWKIGFFKRNGKEKLDSLKSSDAIPLDTSPFLLNE